MTPFQQLYLGLGAKKTPYLDDVFSTYLYRGQGGTTTTITNGINLSGDGGMVWTKGRSAAKDHMILDTVRGATKRLKANDNVVENTGSNYIQAFNNNGYSVGSDDNLNGNNVTNASWTFRKAKGFFDVVTWDGNGTAGRVISHSLGSVPGLIMVKSTTDATAWFTYHRDLGHSAYLLLNETNTESTSQGWFMNDTAPTSTGFSLGSSSNVNGSGRSYVAYVFAGGESPAATAKSVLFDGSNDYITIPTHADLALGTGDLTIEGWFTTDTLGAVQMIYDGRDNTSTNRIGIWVDDTNKLRVNVNNSSKDSMTGITKGHWYHFAFTRQGTTSKLFLNGIEELSWSDSIDYAAPASNAYLGGYSTSHSFDGKISNFRIVKGTAVYTASFRPPTQPLTNITNTKLLCCNASTAPGYTVSPTTLTDSGAVAKGDSPFDDPDAFKFGENEDQGIIKCGSFTGNGSSKNDIFLGWEPQYILFKNVETANQSWCVFDSMRGIVTDGNDDRLLTNTNEAEITNTDYVQLIGTGFRITSNSSLVNADTKKIIYMAIRRPDGYVGKPADAGTGVFAMDTSNSSATIPTFDSGFPVDFALVRNPTTGNSWETCARLTQGFTMYTDQTMAKQTYGSSTFKFDSNVGWLSDSGYNSNYHSWMFKRHTGFDVVTYKGDTRTTAAIPHGLNAIPEMIWVKCHSAGHEWNVYHKGLNGGSSPEDYFMYLNTTAAESNAAAKWNGTAPTATHFSLTNHPHVYYNNEIYLAILFASVDGISKVGYYDGSDSAQTITTGFQPRFVMIKKASASGTNWVVLDTTRGWGSGDDKWLKLDDDDAQITYNLGEPTSTGFTLQGGSPTNSNISGAKFIYYAHA